jgi:hypothetical protein
MAAPTVQARQISGGSAADTVSKPAGGAAGDVYCILVHDQEGGSSTPPSHAISGFTKIGATDGQNNPSFGNWWFGSMFAKTHTGSEGVNFALTGGIGSWCYFNCLLIDGADTTFSNWVKGSYSQGSGGTITVSGITIPAADTLALFSGSDWDGATYSRSGWTVDTAGSLNAAPVLKHSALGPGATGNLAFNSTSGSRHTGFLAAIPAPGGAAAASQPLRSRTSGLITYR